MTEAEIQSYIFQGCGVSVMVGVRDRFNDEQIIEGLGNHPAYDHFSTHFQDWIWNAIDTIISESLD